MFYNRFNVKYIFRNKFWFTRTYTDELRHPRIQCGLQEEKQALLFFETFAESHAAVCAKEPAFMFVFLCVETLI